MFNHYDPNFPQHLKDARVKKGLTQNDLAAMVGVSGVSISQWEKGLKRPRPSKVHKLDEIFTEVNSVLLTEATTDELIQEMKRRGWSFTITK